MLPNPSGVRLRRTNFIWNSALLAEIREAMGGELTAEERAWRERIARLTERIHAYFAEWRPGAGEPYYLTNERT